ncbi:PREDICTED: probable G-protein coupled receptor AH9.1 [Priapulus caudatus]|uniref:Probable G-protein coupled receptor AH9.1 n=1 Tax=Priapulus caudatus TaxID=37621 RepID=A0ABM1F5K4_PRICU|nr:PREDICTED: probable G-protein coupled receptor AH9.1 [Priapulus caudatus]
MLPIMVLLILNPLILKAHRESLIKRQRMQRKQTRDEREVGRQQRRLQAMLLAVSIIFVVCTLPSVVLSIVRLVFSQSTRDTWQYETFNQAVKLLEVTNFAINFYVYSLASTDFRHSLADVTRCHTSGAIYPLSGNTEVE